MKDPKNLKITYIGGGSRGWAFTLMNDLAQETSLGGTITLYDIDKESADKNVIIGNNLSARSDVVGKWCYQAVNTLELALRGADFVIISILPGTFDEMESDVHYPEKYGIYQSVGDTTGPGGIVRALRTLPMFREIALAIKKICPDAWVINFTNPMTVCVRTLYKVFPQIKAFGCCHEVFGTQQILRKMLSEKGITAERHDIKINVLGVNHFTWITEAKYKGMDLMPLYKKYVEDNPKGINKKIDDNWVKIPCFSTEQVKFDLFKKYGAIAAAGDRHLAEFCPGYWYLKDKETVENYGFTLTSVAYRKNDLLERKQKQDERVDGKAVELIESGEESIRQIKALCGMGDFVTNVNIPNYGQVPNNPMGAVLETNALFTGDSVRPIFAGQVPQGINALVTRIIEEQEMVVEAALTGNYELAFTAFRNNPNVCLPLDKARELFDQMLENTKSYLPYYEQYKQGK